MSLLHTAIGGTGKVHLALTPQDSGILSQNSMFMEQVLAAKSAKALVMLK